MVSRKFEGKVAMRRESFFEEEQRNRFKIEDHWWRIAHFPRVVISLNWSTKAEGLVGGWFFLTEAHIENHRAIFSFFRGSIANIRKWEGLIVSRDFPSLARETTFWSWKSGHRTAAWRKWPPFVRAWIGYQRFADLRFGAPTNSFPLESICCHSEPRPARWNAFQKPKIGSRIIRAESGTHDRRWFAPIHLLSETRIARPRHSSLPSRSRVARLNRIENFSMIWRNQNASKVRSPRIKMAIA